MNLFDKLLVNISWSYKNGYPDFTIKEDREALYDYLVSIGFPHSAIIELSERFIREKIDDETIIKYRDEDGESQEMKAGSAKTMPADHPAKQQWDKMAAQDGGDDSGAEKGQKIGGSDFDRDGGAE